MTDKERINAAVRLLRSDPILLAVVSQLAACGDVCFESNKDSVNAFGLFVYARIGSLLYGEGEVFNYPDEDLEIICQDALDAHNIPEREPIIQ